MSDSFDPVTLEVLWNRLVSITEEQARTLMRTGLSNVLSDAGDLSACLFDRRGRMLAQAALGTPGHINCLAEGILRFMEHFPEDRLEPGDVLIGNNSYELSGHLYDITIVTPVFRGRTIVAYLASTCHVVDIGGRGMTTESESIFEEGLHLPYLKYHRAGAPNLDIMAIINANSREPVKVLGDLRAQVVANEVSGQRVIETLEEFGLADLDALADQVTAMSERAMRQAISDIRDGSYTYTLQSDGIDAPVVLKTTLTVTGDRMTIDFAGSSPASRKAVNVCLNFTAAYAFYAVKAALVADIPNNDGSFRPIEVTAPKGSILNAEFPMPTVARHSISHFVAECVMGALAKAVPDKVVAEGAGATWPIVTMGYHADGRPFSSIIFTHGGMGARMHKDGMSATPFPSGVRGTPVEIMESNAPLLIHSYELRPDTGGPGRYRGGLGQEIRFGIRTGTPWRLPLLVDKTQIAPRGLAGGEDGTAGAIWLNTDTPLTAKGTAELSPDDQVTFHLPGGGGSGRAFDRPPAQVLHDVAYGYVSVAAARDRYGVVITGTGPFDIDQDATRRLRAAKGMETAT